MTWREIESGVTGRGHFQLRPERSKFRVDKGMEEIVRRQGIRVTKRRAHHISHGAGARAGSEGSRGHHPRLHQHQARRTAHNAGGRTCNGGGGLRTGRHDGSLHAKMEVQRRRALDLEDVDGVPKGDWMGGLHSRHEQTIII